jgi:hypothetical protein
MHKPMDNTPQPTSTSMVSLVEPILATKSSDNCGPAACDSGYSIRNGAGISTVPAALAKADESRRSHRCIPMHGGAIFFEEGSIFFGEGRK